MPKPQSDDLMIAREVLADLTRSDASIALVDLFAVHGRSKFAPTTQGLPPRWHGRGARQRFALAISVLHAVGHLRWFPDGRYRIVSDAVMTGAEFEQRHPDAKWESGAAWLT
jgi:hypothetical protein